MLNKDHIKSIERCFVILDCLHTNQENLTLENISRSTGLKKTTCFRILKTLRTLNLVEMAGTGKQYRFGPRLAVLGLSALKTMNLRKTALPVLQQLRDETGETVNLSILNDTEIIFIERIMSDYRVNLNVNVGDRLPVFCASMGKVILANLPDNRLQEILASIKFVALTDQTIVTESKLMRELEHIRQVGFAINNEELEKGLRAVAAPIFNYTGEAFAAVNIAWTTARQPDSTKFESYTKKIVAAARQISWLMGHGPSK